MYPQRPLGDRLAVLLRHLRHARHVVGLDLPVVMVVVALARFIPHPPNMTAVLPFAMLCAQRYPRWVGCSAVLCLALCTDALLGLWYGYPTVGGWTFYTYSGFVAVVAATHSLPTGRVGQWCAVVSVSLGYWLWTNWGVWLGGAMYPQTWAGLLAAYINALPFLGYAVVGNVGWFLVLKKLWQYLPWYVPCVTHGRSVRWPHQRHEH